MTFLKLQACAIAIFFSATRNIGDLYTIKDLACSGQGIAILPETLVGEDLDSGKLKRIPELNHYFASKIFILTPLSHTAISAPVRNFIDLAYEFLNPKKISQKEKARNDLLPFLAFFFYDAMVSICFRSLRRRIIIRIPKTNDSIAANGILSTTGSMKPTVFTGNQKKGKVFLNKKSSNSLHPTELIVS